MDFLSQYGLFLLKSLTIVICFLLALIGLFAIGKKPKPKLEVVSINQEYQNMKQQLEEAFPNRKSTKIKLRKKEEREAQKKPHLYVIDFNGDMKGSQVEQLREAITAILAVAQEKDEVLLRLESPGGVVNGYGLAASQLQRIRDKSIPLTVCIDKVAASGGYLMACIAHNIIAAPFAIIGSIGVVSQIPNLHRWLKKHDIDVELITAGEHKRTLTLLGENTEKGRKKFQEDLEKIHQAFRNFVFNNRQQIDIDQVATGEHWLAVDAYNLKLVDVLQTSDQYIIEKLQDFNVYKITIHHKGSVAQRILKMAMQLFNRH